MLFCTRQVVCFFHALMSKKILRMCNEQVQNTRIVRNEEWHIGVILQNSKPISINPKKISKLSSPGRV